MGAHDKAVFDPAAFLAKAGPGRKIVELKKKRDSIFQGNDAGFIYFIQKGRMKLTVLSKARQRSHDSITRNGEFLGEDCIATMQPMRLATASALTPCTLMCIRKKEMVRVIEQENRLSGVFVSFLLPPNVRIQEGLIDQLFNSNEKRLARALLLLAHVGKEGKPGLVIPRISHGALAEMVGTTRSRISFFMNRFRKLGFIECNGAVRVHTSLLSVVL